MGVRRKPRRSTRTGWQRITTKISASRRGCCQSSCTSISTIFMPIAAGPMTWATKSRNETALELLDWWERELDACYEGKPSHPVLVALRETVVAKDVPKQPFADLLKAFRQDQVVKRYPTWDSVIDYCVYSANPVGRLVLYLCGYRDEQRQRLSDATCTALQLANFWQDVSHDLEKGRIYIPLDRAAARGLTEKDIVGKKFDERYVELMKDLIAQTRKLFDQGMPLAKMVDGKLSVDLEMFSRGGVAVLDAIEAMGYDTLNGVPRSAKASRFDCWAGR